MDKEEIIGIIADLYEEYEISELGFDLKNFCDKAGIILVPYSSYYKQIYKLLLFDEDGFNIINKRSNACEIYYNDLIEPKQRIKFTIPHEIGHIMLGHNLKLKQETQAQNREANFFANEFYCPSILMFHFELTTISKMISTFGISAQYAEVLLDKLIIKVGKGFSNNEKRLLRIFINNKHKKNNHKK